MRIYLSAAGWVTWDTWNTSEWRKLARGVTSSSRTGRAGGSRRRHRTTSGRLSGDHVHHRWEHRPNQCHDVVRQRLVCVAREWRRGRRHGDGPGGRLDRRQLRGGGHLTRSSRGVERADAWDKVVVTGHADALRNRRDL